MSLQVNAAWLELIMKIGPLPDRLPEASRTPAGGLPDALKPGFQCVRTHWIRGFMGFQLARCTRTVLLMVPE